MTRKEKSAKKKTRKESEEENPVMQEADINRLLKDALDQANAQHELERHGHGDRALEYLVWTPIVSENALPYHSVLPCGLIKVGR